MPIYDYQCPKCNSIKEVYHKMFEDIIVVCHSCSRTMTKVISIPNITIKKDIMDHIKAARIKHGYCANQSPQQDAADKYWFDKKAGGGDHMKVKKEDTINLEKRIVDA